MALPIMVLLLSVTSVNPFVVSRTDTFITARCYASAVLAMALCPSVCVCLSQVGVLLKRLNVGSQKQHHTIAQGF